MDVAVQKFHAGEIFATNNMSVIFECKGCDEPFGIYTKFLDHIFGVHFEDWTTTEETKKVSNQNKNKNEPALPALPATSVPKYYAGDLYATSNLCISIECKKCEENFRVYTKFLDHIFGKHFEDWTTPGKLKSNTTVREVQYLEIERNVDGQYCSRSNFITNILQPMEGETVGAMPAGLEQESQDNASAEVTPKHLRLFKGKTRKHDIKRKHKCSICGFYVSGIHNLKAHEQRHSAIKPYACLKCDKSFYTSTELNSHVRRHNGIKPYVCTYCGLSFVGSSQLTSHEKRHTNDRRYKCDVCDKRFYDKKQLENHSVVHTKIRNFVCEECNTRFTRRNALRTHMKLHTNALEYECRICHMRFNQKPTLLWHTKTKHNVIEKEREDNSNVIGEEYDSTY